MNWLLLLLSSTLLWKSVYPRPMLLTRIFWFVSSLRHPVKIIYLVWLHCYAIEEPSSKQGIVILSDDVVSKNWLNLKEYKQIWLICNSKIGLYHEFVDIYLSRFLRPQIKLGDRSRNNSDYTTYLILSFIIFLWYRF